MIKPVTAICLIMSAIVSGLIATHANAAPPIRLHFAPGSYGVMANGRVTASEPYQVYTFDANAGQTMIITFTGAGPMRGQVQCLGGGDGPYYGTGNTFSIPGTGECQITVGANTMADNWTGGFTLAILVN
jgi:hypothetical protein